MGKTPTKTCTRKQCACWKLTFLWQMTMTMVLQLALTRSSNLERRYRQEDSTFPRIESRSFFATALRTATETHWRCRVFKGASSFTSVERTDFLSHSTPSSV